MSERYVIGLCGSLAGPSLHDLSGIITRGCVKVARGAGAENNFSSAPQDLFYPTLISAIARGETFAAVADFMNRSQMCRQF